MKNSIAIKILIGLCGLFILNACGSKKASVVDMQTRIDSLQAALNTYVKAGEKTTANLRRFDSLDYNITNQHQWGQFAGLYDTSVVVNYPDATFTGGLSTYLETVKPMFSYAPDAKITQHPVSIGSGDWTATIQEIRGTFTDTMHIPYGKPISPTGNSFIIKACTMARWLDGKIVEQYLFVDNLSFMKRIGALQ